MFCFGCYRKPIYDSALRKATKHTNFSYKNKKLIAKVVDVYDGDTITVVFRYRGELQQHKIRLLGIDTPEMKPIRPKNPTKQQRLAREEEVRKAKSAQIALKEHIDNQLIHLECQGFDKYGRILGTIYTRGKILPWRRKINLNQWLIETGHAQPYDGGTKAT